jgi:hypothetical protein
MSLNIKALAITAGILWGASYLLVGILNLIFPSYGVAFLELGASLYPGYAGPNGVGSVLVVTAGPNGVGSVLVVTLYALLDGAIAGAIVAWLYNLVAGTTKKGTTPPM